MRKRIIWFLLSILISFILILTAAGILFLVNDFSFSEYLKQLPGIIKQFIREPIFWIVLSIPYLIVRWIRFWFQGFKSGG